MLTATVYDEVTGEYYTRKATEFDGVGDPGEESEIQMNKYYLGDMTPIEAPTEIDVDEMTTTIDELEYSAWDLFCEYCDAFGVHLKRDDIDFYTAKQIQDCVIKLFEDAGVKFVWE